MAMEKTKLLLVDDHTVIRSGLRMLLDNEEDVEIIAEAGTAEEALEKAVQHKPDVVVMDIGLPDQSGIEVAAKIKDRLPKVAIVALTIHEDEEYFFKMLEAGASGYVPKRAAPEELLKAIRTAALGQVYLYPTLANLLVKDYLSQDEEERATRNMDGLTPREQEVLIHLAEGLNNPEIGDLLGISPKTVARHRENIMRKLNLHSRTELVKYAIRKGIIKP
jgi:two-component system response regulator NreC